MGIFDSLFGAFDPAHAQDAAQQRIQGLQNAQASANTSLGQGLTSANNYLGQAYNLYGPLAALAGKGSDAYANALGLNGAEGSAAARTAFTSLPGYQEGFNTGLDTLERRAAARGQLGSGNTSADTLRYASDYANTKYGDYLSNLSPFLNLNQSVTGAQAGILGGQGANALDIAKLQGGLGYQTEQGIGNANAEAALAPVQSSQNFINTLLGIGQIAASAIPFGGGSRAAPQIGGRLGVA